MSGRINDVSSGSCCFGVCVATSDLFVMNYLFAFDAWSVVPDLRRRRNETNSEGFKEIVVL